MKELYDRFSFRKFLHYHEITPDSGTIWLFSEVLSSTGKDRIIWKETRRQFKEKGITEKSGTIRDTTFIENDLGKHGGKKPPVPVDLKLAEIREEKVEWA